VPDQDLLRGLGDGGQPGQAQLVDGRRGHAHRDAGPGGGQPGRVRAGPGLHDVAQDDGVDLVPGDPGAAQRGAGREGAQVRRRQPGERSEQLADGGAGPGDEHWL